VSYNGAMRWAALLYLVAACGRVGFDPLAPPELGPFGEALPIPGVNSTSEDDDPTLSADGLEMYFASDRTGALGAEDVWVATRTSLDAPWSDPVPVPNLNSTAIDKGPGLARDGLNLFFVSDRGATKPEMYFATRADRASAWGAPQRIAELSLATGVGTPAVDGARMVLRVTEADGTTDLYASEFGGGLWSPPVAISELETPENESGPELMPGGQRIYFDSDNPAGLGGIDIYVADVDPATGKFLPAQQLEGIASAAIENDAALSSDERVLVFARRTPAGDHDLFEARR
jgi:hypothetical protein